MKVLTRRSDVKLFWIVTIIEYGFKIIGLAPFSQKTKTPTKNSRNTCTARAFHFSKIGLAYNILLLILLQVATARVLPTLFSLSYANSSPVSVAIDMAQGIMCCITTHVIIITWAIWQEDAACVMNRLSEVDRLLSGLEKQPQSNKGTFIFFAAHVIFNAYLWITFSSTEAALLSDAVLAWCFFGTPSFIIYWFIIEYNIAVRLVAREIERVNRNLMKLQGFPIYVPIAPFLNDYSAVLSLSTHSQLARLQLLYTVRTMLSEVSQDIADFFSFPILPAIGCLFFMLVNTVYYLLSPVLGSSDDFSLNIILNTLAWLLISVFPLSLLGFNVTSALEKAKLTGRIVHKLLATEIRREIKAELKQFSLQLLHENISFTAYGFFKIDCTMLHSILGAAATYLVILIQFRPQTDETCCGA